MYIFMYVHTHILLSMLLLAENLSRSADIQVFTIDGEAERIFAFSFYTFYTVLRIHKY